MRVCPTAAASLAAKDRAPPQKAVPGQGERRYQEIKNPLENRNNGGTEGFLDVSSGCVRGENFDKGFGCFGVLIALADSQYVGEGLSGVGLWILGQQQRINDAGIQSVVAVDDGEVNIRQGSWQLSGFNFQNFNVFRIVDDVFNGSIQANAFGQSDQAAVSQKLEGAGFVGWVIWNSDGSAVFDVFKVVALAFVDAERFKVNFYSGNQVNVAAGAEFFKVWGVLEEV